MMDDRILFHEW